MVEVKKLHCCHCLLWLHVYTVTIVYVKLLMHIGKVVSSVSTHSSATAAKAAGLPSGMIVLTISYVHTCSIYSAPNSAQTCKYTRYLTIIVFPN